MFPSFGEKSMKRLEENVRKNVMVDFVFAGEPQSIIGELEAVSRFKFVEIVDLDETSKSIELAKAMIKEQGTDTLKLPFIWTWLAIKTISGPGIVSPKTLYDNFWIRNSYSEKDSAKVYELAELFYGKEAARNLADLKIKVEYPIIKLVKIRRKCSFNQ